MLIAISGGPHDYDAKFIFGVLYAKVSPMEAKDVEEISVEITGLSPGVAQVELGFFQSPFSAVCPLTITVTEPSTPQPPQLELTGVPLLVSHSGRHVRPDELVRWLDLYFEDGNPGDGVVESDINYLGTQCFGADLFPFLDDTATGGLDTVRFTNATAVSAQEAGRPSEYSGYHQHAALAMDPMALVGDVHTEGVQGKHAAESPVHQGDLTRPLSGVNSTHWLVWAGLPQGPDWLDIARIQTNFYRTFEFDREPNTLHILAGDGTDPYANGPATAEALERALFEIGQIMGPGETFTFFVTDHGSIFTPARPPPEVKRVATSGGWAAREKLVSFPYEVDLGSGILDAISGETAPSPTLELHTASVPPRPEEILLTLNGEVVGSLADAAVESVAGPEPSTQWLVYALEFPEAFLRRSGVQEIELWRPLDAELEVELVGIGSGPIAKGAAEGAGIPCSAADTTTLCLAGGRFEVRMAARDLRHQRHLGQATPMGGGAGFFTLFAAGNPELAVKVVDGRAVNGEWWFFHAGLSNLATTLLFTDTETGRTRRVHHPAGVFRSAAFGWADDSSVAAGSEGQVASGSPSMVEPSAHGAASTTLALHGGRFEIEVEWSAGALEGRGHPAALSSASGTFSFFGEHNPEVVVKILDGRALTGTYWLFVASLSNLELKVTVTDTDRGTSTTIHNPPGSFLSRADLRTLGDR